ncbi:MAG: type IV pili twitching motility protein PilT, partial [Cellulosilyticum sp.]|nr:type IV pili twitching motility protein PilT [Cellulosilyticum sp.]
MQIKELLGCVIGQGASDLHLTVGLPPMIRVDGQIKPMMLPKLTDMNIKEIVGQLLEDKPILLENFK